jgi:hypothetical protein
LRARFLRGAVNWRCGHQRLALPSAFSLLFIAGLNGRSQCRRASADLWTTNRQDGVLARFFTIKSQKKPQEKRQEKVWASEQAGGCFNR